MDLNELAFQKLKELRPNRNNIISFPKIKLQICRKFSIKKECCWKLLRDFRDERRIEIVCGHGIRVCEIN